MFSCCRIVAGLRSLVNTQYLAGITGPTSRFLWSATAADTFFSSAISRKLSIRFETLTGVQSTTLLSDLKTPIACLSYSAGSCRLPFR